MVINDTSLKWHLPFQNLFPKKSLVTLYKSLVESRLGYCDTVWGNCGETLKNKLQRLQDRAARVVTKTKYG